MTTKLPMISAASVLVAVSAVAGFSKEPRATLESCEGVLQHEVCTWVVMEGANAVELGATIPMGLVEAVPADAEMKWPPEELEAIPFPAEARASLGIDHLGINWEAHGHPPGPFLTPHFDFHFYNLSEGEVGVVNCEDETKPESLPKGYTLPDVEIEGLGVLLGLCVPRMGMHGLPTKDLEAAGPFSATMLIGYYEGQGIFFEPMVSRDRLLERSSFVLSVPAVTDLPAGVHYPSELRAEYDAAKDEYRLVMTGFNTP